MRAWENTCFWEGDKMRRRGQEEIVGFVMVVVIVAIIFLILLGIFVRRGDTGTESESRDIQLFLESVMEQTSACAVDYEPDFSDLGELIKECHEFGERACTSGKRVCEVLEEELGRALELGWNVVAESYYKGYVFNASYVSGEIEEEIIVVQKGECGASVRGGEVLRDSFPGTIVSSLKVCF